MASCSKGSNNPVVVATLPKTPHPNRTQSFSLWQIEAVNNELQIGHILKTYDGKIVVIDTVTYLEQFIEQLGGHVHYWITTHPHPDHINALVEILGSKKIPIDTIIHSAQNLDWIQKYEPTYYPEASAYYNRSSTQKFLLSTHSWALKISWVV